MLLVFALLRVAHRLRDRRARRARLLRGVRPARELEHVRVERLHAERDPRDAAPQVAVQLGVVERARVHLHGHLRVRL